MVQAAGRRMFWALGAFTRFALRTACATLAAKDSLAAFTQRGVQILEANQFGAGPTPHASDGERVQGPILEQQRRVSGRRAT